MSDKNPHSTISNLDLELAGSLLHLDCAAQCLDVHEHTILSKGDNLATTFWEQKVSSSTNSPSAYLLWLFGLCQRFHQSVPQFDYLPGSSNVVADALLHDFSLSWNDFFSSVSTLLPQPTTFQVWTPSQKIISLIISALPCKQLLWESLLVKPTALSQLGTPGLPSPMNWPSTPFSKPSAVLQVFLHRVCSGELLANGVTYGFPFNQKTCITP